MRAVLSIGSNMDDRRALLQTVFDEFAEETVAVSPVFSTPPWGVEDQDEFLNAVLIVEVNSTPMELLRRGQGLEQDAERVRGPQWRTLDVDIVQVDGITSEDPELTLPHPFARERAFVLVPWLAADPKARLGDTAVADLVAGLDPHEVEQVKPL